MDAVVHALGTSLPSCSVVVEGAIGLSWDNAQVTGSIEGWSASPDSGPPNEVALTCSFTQGAITYSFEPRLQGVTGPGTYVATAVQLAEDCTSSCPGAYGFAAYAPATTCVFVVDRFSPATRGGLSATFTCPSLPISDFEDLSDPKTVSITGSIDLPAVAPSQPPMIVDAGAPVDAGPPSCVMEVSGAYDGVSVEGTGEFINGLTACGASLNGVLYELGMGAGDTLMLSGGSWCTSGCEVEYVTSSPCVVDVLVDDGVGGAFKATFRCEGMYVPGFVGVSDAGGTETIDITGSIDGKHLPPPPLG